MPQFERIGQHVINLNETYYLAYAGGKRELPAKDQKEFNKLITLPFLLKQQELSKIPLDRNPNVVPMTGRRLLSFIKELRFVPLFDLNFKDSHLLQLTDVIIYESIRQKKTRGWAMRRTSTTELSPAIAPITNANA